MWLLVARGDYREAYFFFHSRMLFLSGRLCGQVVAKGKMDEWLFFGMPHELLSYTLY